MISRQILHLGLTTRTVPYSGLVEKQLTQEQGRGSRHIEKPTKANTIEAGKRPPQRSMIKART